MTVQALQEIVMPNGIRIKPGAVLDVPDAFGTALVDKGLARVRTKPGPVERKTGPGSRIMPGDPLPPAVPYVRVPADPQPAASYEPGAYEDVDNFVRDMVTFVAPFGWYGDWWDDSTSTPPPPVTPTGSASAREPVLTLDQIKLFCHIEPDVTDEDNDLLQFEMAARLHAENFLRYQIDATVGENIKQALLMLIAHFYRNREAVTTGRTSVGQPMPFGFKELLYPERDFPIY